MSNIFRERKIPRHLIIHDDYERLQRSRSWGWRVLFGLLVVVGIAYVAIMLRQ